MADVLAAGSGKGNITPDEHFLFPSALVGLYLRSGASTTANADNAARG